MSYLADTHTFLWFMRSDRKLSRSVAALFDAPDGPVYLSAASVFEIAIKHRIGKMPEAEPFIDRLPVTARQAGFVKLDMTWNHALRSGQLDTHHKDPFDRMLFAQALEEDLTFLSNEQIADTVGVRRLW